MECDICLIEWDCQVHIPRILNCGHTICEVCLLNMFNKKGGEMVCPSCMKKQKEIKKVEDIQKLIKNINLLRIVEKLDTKKNNQSSFLNSKDLNFSFLNKTINSARLSSTPIDLNINNYNHIYFNNNETICKTHNLPSHSYAVGTNLLFCDICVKETNLKTYPLPNYIKDIKRKIDSTEIKINLIKNEIERLTDFFYSYQQEFEQSNLNKIEELFNYLNKLLTYNYNTAKTVVLQCKKEQDIQINERIKELKLLLDDLIGVNIKVKEIKSKQNDEKALIKYIEELNEIYHKVNYFLNYEMELNLFQMQIGVRENIKEKLFDFIQNAYYVDVDFVSIKNEAPLIKHILQKEKTWQCVCGEFDIINTTCKCSNCGIFRKVESYDHILANPLYASKEEINLYNQRKKIEVKDFQQIYSKKIDPINNNISTKYYAVDLEWFLTWKCYVTNDLTEKYVANNKKRISPNKLIGLLPPGPITNYNLYEKGTVDFINIKNLKKGLKKNDDYVIVTEFLWEFFIKNYNGGPEILIENSQCLELANGVIGIKNSNFEYINENNGKMENKITPSKYIENNNIFEKNEKDKIANYKLTLNNNNNLNESDEDYVVCTENVKKNANEISQFDFKDNINIHFNEENKENYLNLNHNVTNNKLIVTNYSFIDDCDMNNGDITERKYDGNMTSKFYI